MTEPGVKDLKPRGIKAPLELLPLRPLRAVAAAMQEGATKYAKDNWRDQGKLTDWRDAYGGAALRHVLAFCDRDEPDIDPDSGVHHLAHAACCCLIALYHAGADYVTPKAAR